MNGVSNRVKILRFLEQAKDPVKKQAIATAVGTTAATVANELAYFTRNELVKETAGWYIITPNGRKLIAEDPFLTALKNRSGGAKFPIDWGYVRASVICRDIVRQAEALKETFEPIRNELLPIVLIYLIASSYPLPTFNGEPQDDSLDQDRFHILNKFIELMQGKS